jgi:hypothetical protein
MSSFVCNCWFLSLIAFWIYLILLILFNVQVSLMKDILSGDGSIA